MAGATVLQPQPERILIVAHSSPLCYSSRRPTQRASFHGEFHLAERLICGERLGRAQMRALARGGGAMAGTGELGRAQMRGGGAMAGELREGRAMAGAGFAVVHGVGD